ncbi:MAG: hypothetical protein VKK59_02680 [Vampirovibrionales bacterium]|nr:hypothetical protein [Vampirovibrionales bacterium]
MSFRKLITSLKSRVSKVLAVIDDALHSDSLRDRIWAVEQILKRIMPDKAAKLESLMPPRRSGKALKDVSRLSDDDIMSELRDLLGPQVPLKDAQDESAS